MADALNAGVPPKKFLINITLFLASIIAVLLLWPEAMKDTIPELLGSTVLVTSCYVVLYLFLSHFRKELLEVSRKTFFLIITILFFFILTSLILSLPGESMLYIIPFAIIPIVIRTFYDARLALFVLLISILLAGFIVPAPFEFIFISFISGVAAIFSLSDMNRRAKLFFSSIVVVFSYSVIYSGLTLAFTGGFSGISLNTYIHFFLNGLLILLAYPLIFLFERKFYFLSDTTLHELCDTNQPLLRRFATEAPGSFHHSLQVAILAEEAARSIGANILLARTGSLYHDIGKILNPGYFIENQNIGVSLHEELSPLDSSRIIIGHVNEGVSIARKYRLPVQIIDFIRTHHGTAKTYYFYKKYLLENGEAGGMENEFVYPGPKPFSKELAIVMMADAVEAASHTLATHDDTTINELVERIMLIQEQEEQFSDSPLTFKEITEIKGQFKNRLLSIYHKRVVYPDMEKGKS